jgi:hypothetical protein
MWHVSQRHSGQRMRDFFIGHWHISGGDPDFYPDKIIFEADPNSADRLLVTFSLKCLLPECSATKARSDAAFLSGPSGSVGSKAVNVPWFKDTAGNQYNVYFQEALDAYRKVASALKEIIPVFSITPPMNRIAYFAVTDSNHFRYFVPDLDQVVLNPWAKP